MPTLPSGPGSSPARLLDIDAFLAGPAGRDGLEAPEAARDADVTLVALASPAAREDAVRALARDWRAAHAGAVVLVTTPPATWPFHCPVAPSLDATRPTLVVATGLEQAFANAQTGGVRLVTTQPAYLLAAWRAALAAHGRARLVATADPGRLATVAPEAWSGRGAWRGVAVWGERPASSDASVPVDGDAGPLALAWRQGDAAGRLRACLDALARTPGDAGLLTAAGSAAVEAGDMDNAARLLEEAIAAAPAHPAAHYELGKLWLRRDDMEAAAPAFAEAARLLPGFAPASANLGATLGELGRTDEALAAFEQARTADPESEQVLNNLGVLYRETGRLADSETAFRRLIELSPELAFGHYNLGHTLFLQGRYRASLLAYREGQAHDPERNPVQASRLALAQLASGDAAGALAELQRCTLGLPGPYRRQLLEDTHGIVWALLTQQPDLAGWKSVTDWLSGELGRAT